MKQNPYQTPEKAESKDEASEKLPMRLIAFQGIMTIAAVLIYIVWISYLKKAYSEYGIELPLLAQHLMNNLFGYLMVGVFVANGLFVAMLASRKRGKTKQSRTWATLFIVFWILFLVYSALIAYAPVFAIRRGGVDIWL